MLYCPNHRLSLDENDQNGQRELRCPEGCAYPVRGGIPRFVATEGYADSFGLQWNVYRTTQLDSQSGFPISRTRLARCLGGSLDLVRGGDVLEAGCGAGRFTEVLLQAGARVTALDLSNAVEAAYANCQGRPGLTVCQADLNQAPVLPASFDVVLCLGVIQHTPDPEATMARLATYVRPRGWLVIDHYSIYYRENATRRVCRNWMKQTRPRTAMRLSTFLSRVFIPVHAALRPPHAVRGLGRLRNALLRVSPVVDYFDYLDELPPAVVKTWMELDTHDALTDYYKHLRTREQIQATLEGLGLESVVTAYAGNGIEARGQKP